MSSSTGFLVGAGFIALASIPLILKVVPRNSFYGFRTPSTLSSDEVWFRANHFAGWALFLAAVVSATLLLAVPADARSNAGYDAALFSLPFVVALGASFIYLRRINRGP
jgi:uncharacterized membrane protein